jgi:hypothetical protein
MPTYLPTGLIINKVIVPCDLPVYNWKDHGMECKVGDGARRRFKKQVIDLFVWHWTGGEGGVKSLFNTLDNRELGVEFFIDKAGLIYQFADPVLVDTFDAGSYNPRSVGCEIQSYGYRAPGRAEPDPDRDEYGTRMNGKRRTFARFYPAQLRAAQALASAVSRAIPTIPLTVPAGPDHKLFPDFIGAKRMRTMRGHVGHYHLTQKKSDPGHDLLQSFLDTKTCYPALV